MTKSRICQSCGMPLRNDKNGPALEKDGTTSDIYCSNCYKEGEFTCPNCTTEDMMKKNEKIMKEMHLPKFLIKAFNKKIPKLDRWNEKK